MIILRFLYYYYFSLATKAKRKFPDDTARMCLSTVLFGLTIPICVRLIDFFFSEFPLWGMLSFLGWVILIYYSTKKIVSGEKFKVGAKKRFSSASGKTSIVGYVIVLFLLFGSIVFGICLGFRQYV